METYAHIDWISCTVKMKEYATSNRANLIRFIRKELPKELSDLNWITTKARNGYNIAMKSETGVMIMGHTERLDMGVHIVTSGEVLINNDSVGLDPIDYLEFILKRAWRITRIDYAVNAINSGISISELAQSIVDKRHVSKARAAPYQDDSIRGGKTQYVGSLKNRTKLFRAYEKDMQKGLDIDWKRFELELHGEPARKSAIIAQNRVNFPRAVRGFITGFIDFPENRIWREIMSDEKMKIDMPAKEIGNTQKWLLESVAPALARELDLNEGFMYKFMQAVQENRE